jgi:hypothetical protein
MLSHDQWQLDASAPELYERYLVPAITSLWAADLIERVAPQSEERVLDVACGTGIVARKAAERMTARSARVIQCNRAQQPRPPCRRSNRLRRAVGALVRLARS